MAPIVIIYIENHRQEEYVMETEVETKQTLPDHVLEYIATLRAFDVLCNALEAAVSEATQGKKEQKLAISLSEYLGIIWGRALSETDLWEYAYEDRVKEELEAIASTFTSDEGVNEFIDVGISSCQTTIRLSFTNICEEVYSRFSQIVELIGQDTYTSTLSVDLEEYDVTVTVLACGLLMCSYLEAMREKFYGQSEYPEEFLDVQKETWKGLHWLEEPGHHFILEEPRQLAIMCRHIQPLSIVRGMQHVYHSLPNLLKAHIGGVDIYIDDLVAEKIEDLEYLECLLTLEKEAANDWFYSQHKTLIFNRLAELLGKRIITENPNMSEAILEAGQIPYCLSIEDTLEYLETRQEGTLYLRMFQVLELFLEQVLFFSMKYPADMLTELILEGSDDKEEDWKAIRDLQDAVEEPPDVVDLFESLILGTYKPSDREDDSEIDYTDDSGDDDDDYDSLAEIEEDDVVCKDTIQDIRAFFVEVYETYQENRNESYEESLFDTFIVDGEYIKEAAYIDNEECIPYYKVVIDGDYYNSHYNYDKFYTSYNGDPVNYDMDWKLEADGGESLRNRIKQCEPIYLYRANYDFIHSIIQDMINYALEYALENVSLIGKELVYEAKYTILKEWKRISTELWKQKVPFKVDLSVYKTMYENVGTILLNLVNTINNSDVEDYKEYLEDTFEEQVFLSGLVGLTKVMYPFFIMMVQSDVNSLLDEGYDTYVELPEDIRVEDLLYTLLLAVKALARYRVPITEDGWFLNEESYIDDTIPIEHIEEQIKNAIHGTVQDWNTLKDIYRSIKQDWEEPEEYCTLIKDQLRNDTDHMTDSEYDFYRTVFHTYENSLRGLLRLLRCYMALYPVVLYIENDQI